MELVCCICLNLTHDLPCRICHVHQFQCCFFCAGLKPTWARECGPASQLQDSASQMLPRGPGRGWATCPQGSLAKPGPACGGRGFKNLGNGVKIHSRRRGTPSAPPSFSADDRSRRPLPCRHSGFLPQRNRPGAAD